MILKFDEYIKEGLWAKGVERSQSGDLRTEDKDFFKQERMRPLEKFDKFYIQCKELGLYFIYHYPKMKHIAQFNFVDEKPKNVYFYKGLVLTDDCTDKEKEIINSDDFIKSIYDEWMVLD